MWNQIERVRETCQKILVVSLPYWKAKKWEAASHMGLLLMLGVVQTMCIVQISYMNREFSNSLTEKRMEDFYANLWSFLWMILFLIPLVVFHDYMESRTIMKWREWLTVYYLTHYFSNKTFYKLTLNANQQQKESSRGSMVDEPSWNTIDNPDQRICADVSSFVNCFVSLFVRVWNTTQNAASFSFILWASSPELVLFLVLYSVCGTLFVVQVFGTYLIPLNWLQSKKEADLRYSVVRVRENAESIAFYSGEKLELDVITQRLHQVTNNTNLLNVFNSLLDVFTSFYSYLSILLPPAILAPKFFAGEIDYGTISQSQMAFGNILNAFSTIIYKFGQLSSFMGSIERLHSFQIQLASNEEHRLEPSIQKSVIRGSSHVLQIEKLYVRVSPLEEPLINNLNLVLQRGESLLVVGRSGVGKTTLLRVVAGLWTQGSGVVSHPTDMLFLPQKPYMPLTNLRMQLLYPRVNALVSDSEMRGVLESLNLGYLEDRCGGFEAQADFSQTFSVGEQQRLAVARVLLAKPLPRLIVLDEATSAMDPVNEDTTYSLLKSLGVSLVSVGHRRTLVQHHTFVLDMDAGYSVVPSSLFRT